LHIVTLQQEKWLSLSAKNEVRYIRAPRFTYSLLTFVVELSGASHQDIVHARQVVLDCRAQEKQAQEALRKASELKRKRQKGGSAGKNPILVEVS
jgi:hypothetical protein